ncbi:MAG TPA: hypothetical protein VF203_06845 [Burkholderiales bacterium]
MASTESRPRRTGRNEVEAPDEERLQSEAARPRTQTSLRDNQRRLGVDPEHKTETMRQRRRGTFP